MKTLIPVLLLSFSFMTHARAAETDPAAAEPARDFEKRLEQKKVTFEFQETPLSEVLNFFRQIAGVNIVADRAIMDEEHNPSINLKVTDMSLKQALGWVCRLTECDWEIKDGAIHVFVPRTVLQEKAAREKEEQARQERMETIAGAAAARRLHVRFPDGTEVTAEGAIFHEQPDLARKLLDRALDPGRDGILAYRFDDAGEATGLLARLALLAPKVKGEYVEDDGLLFLTADELPALRKAASFMRKLGHYDVEVDTEPKDDDADDADDADDNEDDDEEDVDVEQVDRDPEARPMATPAADPAQAVNF